MKTVVDALGREVVTSGEKFFIGDNKVVSLQEEEISVGKPEARRGLGNGFDEAKGEKALLLLTPKGERVKHACSLRFEVPQVAGPEKFKEGMGGEAFRRENVDHVVGRREDVAADWLARGVQKASKEETSNREAPFELKRAKGFDGDDRIQARVEDDLRRKGEKVRTGVFKKGAIIVVVGVGLVGKEVGVLPGIILQNAPTTSIKIKVKERQQDLGLFFADKDDVKVGVWDDNVVVRRVAAGVGENKELWGVIEERRKGGVGDRTDGTKAEFPETGNVILQRNVCHNDAGAD